MARARFFLFLPFLLTLVACGRGDEGALKVAFIDTPESLYQTGVRLSAGAQHLRAATGAGLVALNANGEGYPSSAVAARIGWTVPWARVQPRTSTPTR